MRKQISLVLNHPIHGTLLQQSEGTNANSVANILLVCACLKILIYLLDLSGLSCIMWDSPCGTRTDSQVESRRLSCSMTCGILVPQPGTEPDSSAL